MVYSPVPGEPPQAVYPNYRSMMVTNGFFKVGQPVPQEGADVSAKAIRVSAGEMEILSMLWSTGPLTLRESHKRFDEFGHSIAYATMQTRLNRMVEKGLVARSADHPACYEAVVTRGQVTLGHLRQIVDKVSQGDVVPLVARLLSEQTLSADQIAELQQLLAQAQQKSKGATNKGKSS